MSIIRSADAGRRSVDAGRYIFTAVILLSFVNGLYARVMLSLADSDLLSAVGSTFGVNLIAWLAMVVIFDLLSQMSLPALSKLDTAILSFTAVLASLPASGLSWIGLTMLGTHLLVTYRSNPGAYRVGTLLITLCFCMFWSPLIFRFFLDYILKIDTMLVAFVSGTSWHENLIWTSDGHTVLQVLEGCSSFTNLSLAFLGFMIARSYYGTRGFLRTVLFIGLSGCAVIVINTCRISVIALRPELYDIAHGPFGSNVAGLLTTFSIAIISNYGAKR